MKLEKLLFKRLIIIFADKTEIKITFLLHLKLRIITLKSYGRHNFKIPSAQYVAIKLLCG